MSYWQAEMSTIDAKAVVNEIYRAAVVTAIAVGAARLAKYVLKAGAPELDFNMKDLLQSTLYIGVGMITKDTLVRQGTLPDDILK